MEKILVAYIFAQMLNSNTSKRPSSEDLKSFKYFSQYDFEALERGKLPEGTLASFIILSHNSLSLSLLEPYPATLRNVGWRAVGEHPVLVLPQRNGLAGGR